MNLRNQISWNLWYLTLIWNYLFIIHMSSIGMIYFFYLQTVNTSSKSLAKNHTHVKKVGHIWEFLFGIYWWTWKTNIYLKNCWSGPVESKINVIFTILHLKKIKKKMWRYHYFTSAYQKSWWYDLQFLRYRVWQTKIGNFRSFFALLLS